MQVDNAVETAKVLRVINEHCAGMEVDSLVFQMECAAEAIKDTGYAGTMGFYVTVGYIGGDPKLGKYAKATLAPWLVEKWMVSKGLL